MSPGVISSIQTVGIGARGSDPGPRARAFKAGDRARAPDPGPAAPAQTRAPGLDPGPQDRGPTPGSCANGRAGHAGCAGFANMRLFRNSAPGLGTGGPSAWFSNGVRSLRLF